LSLTPRNANVTGTEVKIRDGISAQDQVLEITGTPMSELFALKRIWVPLLVILASGHDDRSEGQYGGLRTENAEDVRRPGTPDLEHGDVFERLTNVEIEIST